MTIQQISKIARTLKDYFNFYDFQHVQRALRTLPDVEMDSPDELRIREMTSSGWCNFCKKHCSNHCF